MSTCQAFFWKSLSWTRFRHRRVRSVGVFSSEGVFSVLAWFSVYRCLWAPGQSVRRCGLYAVVCIPENSILILAKQSSKVAEAGARRPSLVPEILSLWFPLLSCSRRRRWSLRWPRAVTVVSDSAFLGGFGRRRSVVRGRRLGVACVDSGGSREHQFRLFTGNFVVSPFTLSIWICKRVW
jgi:hypothetical protein